MLVFFFFFFLYLIYDNPYSKVFNTRKKEMYAINGVTFTLNFRERVRKQFTGILCPTVGHKIFFSIYWHS